MNSSSQTVTSAIIRERGGRKREEGVERDRNYY